MALAVLLPFLGKPFTIDDLTFLVQAQHIIQDPLHPTAFDMVFDGEWIRLSDHLVSGPVMGYLLVPAVASGHPEIVAHSVQLLMLAIGLIATASLAIRLGLTPIQAAFGSMIVVVSPGVLGMTATAMADVPAMALGVAGMERLVAWKQSNRMGAGIAAGVLLSLAALARPHLLLLVPLGGLFLALGASDDASGSRSLLHRVVPVILSVLLLALVTYGGRDPVSGSNLAVTTLTRLDMDRLWTNLSNVPLQWTLTFPLVALWIPAHAREFFRSRAVLIGVALGFVVAMLSEDWNRAVIGAIGSGVLVHVTEEAWRRRDRRRLMLCAWVLIPFATVWYQHLPAKYLVPSAPAMALLVAGLPLERFRPRRWLLALTGIAGVILGAAIVRADTALAEIGRRGGAEVARQVRRGEKVWSDGGWGYQWYAMAAGAEPLAINGPRARPGDIVVVSLNPRVLERAYPNKERLSVEIFSKPGGRLFGNGAGFYTSGPFPWVWGDFEIGRIEVWRILSEPPKE